MAEAASLDDKAGTASRWHEELRRAEKAERTWRDRSDKIVKLYRRQERSIDAGETRRRFAILWANTEVLKPATYARAPQPVVTRRFKDRDKVAKDASEVLERCLSTLNDLGNDDATYKQVRDEFLLVARGVGRVRYEATPGEVDPTTGQPSLTERAPFDHVYRKDFLHGPARTWQEVPWVAFRAWLTKDQWAERFPKIDFKVEESKDDTLSTEDKPRKDKAAVWEVWDKSGGKVCWVSLLEPNYLDEGQPHLKFNDFFPCPEPVYGTLTTDSLIPSPDYYYYQDQAEEIDDLTSRIGRLQDSLKLVGFYPGGSEHSAQIETALTAGVENKMIPIDSWAAFAEKGGAAAIVWLPIKDVAECLTACVELRRQLIEDVYQITGISDIVRGQTDPNETATAQGIKSQWGSIRIKERQQSMQRFARDIQRLRAEVIAENFQPKTLLEMSGKKLPTEAEVQQAAQAQAAAQQAQQRPEGQSSPSPMAPMTGQPQGVAAPSGPISSPQQDQTPTEPPITLEAVMKLLRDDKLRGFRVDVETDSTISGDEQAEQQEWSAMLTAVGALLNEAATILPTAPLLLPVFSQLLMTTVRKFRVGRSSEDVIEQALDQMEQQAKQQASQPPPPSPEEQKAQAELQVITAKAELDAKKGQQDLQMAQAKNEMELQKMQAQLALEAEKLKLKRQELDMKREEMALNAEASMQEHSLGMQTMERKHELGLETMDAKAEAAKKTAAAKPKAANGAR